MHNSIVEKIAFEITQIDDLFSIYEPLLSLTSKREPDIIELTALATVLHSFYNGIEGIFILIAKQIDKNIPTGMKWHQQLLDSLSLATESRKAVLSHEGKLLLQEYLMFRHFFRHAYSFHLNWTRMKPLVLPIEESWNTIRSELKFFLEDHFGTTLS